MIRVMIESPYAGEVDKNRKYLQECIRHSISLKEAPFASHQMYTDALNDNNYTERTTGINAGYEWMEWVIYVIFYIDYGMSKGMHLALNKAIKLNKDIVFRKLRKGE